MKSTTERGYGTPHQAARRQWQARINEQPQQCFCVGHCGRHHGRCPVTIDSRTRWDLGHNDDRTGYAGPECVPCNRAAGARTVNEQAKISIRTW